MYARGDGATLLGVTPAVIDKQHQRGQILGVPYGNDIHYPAAQFHDRAIVTGSRQVLHALGDTQPWGQLQLLVAPIDGFGDTPASLLNLQASDADINTRAQLVALAAGWATFAAPHRPAASRACHATSCAGVALGRGAVALALALGRTGQPEVDRGVGCAAVIQPLRNFPPRGAVAGLAAVSAGSTERRRRDATARHQDLRASRPPAPSPLFAPVCAWRNAATG